MGKASYFFSATVGFGTRAKLVVNSLMGTMVAAFGEGLALSENVGLDPLKIIEVINGGAIQVRMLTFELCLKILSIQRRNCNYAQF